MAHMASSTTDCSTVCSQKVKATPILTTLPPQLISRAVSPSIRPLLNAVTTNGDWTAAAVASAAAATVVMVMVMSLSATTDAKVTQSHAVYQPRRHCLLHKLQHLSYTESVERAAIAVLHVAMNNRDQLYTKYIIFYLFFLNYFCFEHMQNEHTQSRSLSTASHLHCTTDNQRSSCRSSNQQM